MLGQMDRAQEEVAALPDWPGINLTEIRRVERISFKDPADLEHYLQAIAAAGIPEWPFGFVGRAEDRVTGAELADLFLDRTWTGQTVVQSEADAPFILQIDKQGRVAYRGVTTILTGEARLEGDRICMRFDGYLRGDWLCGHVFRNEDAGNAGARHSEDYIYLLSDAVRYFSMAPS
jgi:adenylate cyclase